VFTSPDLVDYIREKRGKLPMYIIERPLENLAIYQKYKGFWESQYEMDQYKDTGRTQECYVLWNSKLRFLHESIHYNPFHSDKFVWCDAGCLRTGDPELIRQISTRYPLYDKISTDQLDIVLIDPVLDKTQRVFINERHFSGAIFGSHKDVILRIHDLFYQRFDEHIQKGIFIGCDQQTICSVYNENRELFHCISSQHMAHDDWRWFYLWLYY